MSKLLLKHDTATGKTIVESLSSSDLPQPVIKGFSNVSSINVAHTFERWVTIKIFNVDGYEFPETEIKSKRCNEGSVDIEFHTNKSGVVKLYI